MTRIGYDAVTPRNMPHDGVIYGGYVDGHWPTLGEVKQRFPGKLYLPVTVNGSHDALCADVETGDFTPQGGARWARDKIRRAGLAWLYCNASTWPQVIHEVHALGLTGHVYYWIAHYDGAPTIPGGAVGKQYLGDFHGYDKSVFAGYLPGIDPKPSPNPMPHPAAPGWYVRPLSFPAPGNPGVTRRVDIKGHGVVPVQFGRDVQIVQKHVGAHVDGLYGPGTAGAVQVWQRARDLADDGVVGPATAGKIGG